MKLPYEVRVRIWYRWHRYICHHLHFRMTRRGLTWRHGPEGSWLYQQQLRWVCGPLDDWAHCDVKLIDMIKEVIRE